MGVFKIQSVATGLFLGVDDVSNNCVYSYQPLTLAMDNGTRAQRWNIDYLGAGVFVRTMLLTTFGLNKYSASTCNLYRIIGNENDARVDFIADGNYLRIKLTNHDLYLSVNSNLTSGVNWLPYKNSDNQRWVCTSTNESFTPVNHTYKTHTYEGRTLHILMTPASNIELVDLMKVREFQRVDESGFCGVNGTYFDPDGGVICVAVQDGVCVSYNGDGFWNATGRGVIGWNGSILRVHETGGGTNDRDAWSLINGEYSAVGTWLQGGIAMHLGNEQWASMFKSQSGSAVTYFNSGTDDRTAMVAHLDGEFKGWVELIVGLASASVTKFREAIQDYLGIEGDGATDSTMYQAILLDGGSSSQLVAKNSVGVAVTANAADADGVSQIVTLKNFN